MQKERVTIAMQYLTTITIVTYYITTAIVDSAPCNS